MKRTLDILSAPFGLSAKDVRKTALAAEVVDDAGAPTGVRFYAMHPVLSMESRVHNVIGLPDHCDTEQGRKQLRASIVCAREFMRDILDERFDVPDPERTVRKLNERIFRFCTRDHDAKELYQATGIDPARAIIDHPLLAATFRERRLPQMRDQLARRPRDRATESELALRPRGRGRDRGPGR